jgi:hypothetical protein
MSDLSNDLRLQLGQYVSLIQSKMSSKLVNLMSRQNCRSLVNKSDRNIELEKQMSRQSW